MPLMRNKILVALSLCAGVVAVLAIAVFSVAGPYGLNTLLRLGGTSWVTVTPNDPQLSSSMRIALSSSPAIAVAGPHKWREVVSGFEVTEMPVLTAGQEVDRLLLARVDPARFRFQVHTAPAGNLDVADWMAKTGALLIINGSYFSRDGSPNTPVVSNGVVLGPSEYTATHGAFTVTKGKVAVQDLRSRDWRAILKGTYQAMVSYPLLVAADGSKRTKSNARWLANRSFVAMDRSGRIILGTTKEAFFSLERLASFLQSAPLDLSTALNLDGGPLACQAIDLNGYRREFCGQWETATDSGAVKLLRPWFGDVRWGLPIVLSVSRK